MALSHVALDTINEGHLCGLITAKAAESLHIEYKRDTYGGNDCSATSRLDTRQRLQTTARVVFPTGTRMPACSVRSSTRR